MFLLAFLCFSNSLFAQQTSIQSWRSMMESCQLGFEKIYTACPHFPKIETYSNDAAFVAALAKWQEEYANEEKQFWNLQEIKRGNPSAYYLGLSDGSKPEVFESSIWEWVSNSKISAQRLNELAPNFPKPVLTNHPKVDSKNYEQQIDFWMKLYPIEYEYLFNAKELTVLNPYYTGYYQPVQMPAFISAPLHETKPYREAYSSTYKGELSYQLSIRAWYFVFEPQKFNELYGNQYRFPEWFNAEKFRADVKQKIEWTKNTPTDVLNSNQGK